MCRCLLHCALMAALPTEGESCGVSGRAGWDILTAALSMESKS